MVKLVEALLHPYRVPGVGKVLSKIDPLSAKLDKTVSNYLDYDERPNKDDPKPWFKRGGKVKKFSKGGSMDDLAPRENLPDKNASEQARAARKKEAKREKYNDLTPRENLPKKYAKGGKVRGDGCCVKGKTKGRFR